MDVKKCVVRRVSYFSLISDAVKILERGFESLGNGASLLDVHKRGEDNVYTTIMQVRNPDIFLRLR